MNRQQIRLEVSKILVKWGMGTRQVAIIEIANLFEENNKEAIKKLDGYKCGQHKKLRKVLGGDTHGKK